MLGVIRCLPEFIYILTTKGMVASFSESDYYKNGQVLSWYLLFTWSKVAELFEKTNVSALVSPQFNSGIFVVRHR